MVTKYSDLDKVCSSLGLQMKKCKKGHMWKGFVNGQYVRIVIHDNCNGADIPNGLFRKYVKELGFNSPDDYFDFLQDL